MKILLTVSAVLLGYCQAMALPRSEVAGSTIVNENRNVRIEANNGSQVNTGIQARGAEIKDSTLTNRFTGTVDARNNSRVNTGIRAEGAQIRNSTITVDTKANITADNATVKTGVDVSEARNSTIKTTYQGNIDARNTTVKAGSVEGEVNYRKVTTDVKQDISADGGGVKIGTVQVESGRASNFGKHVDGNWQDRGGTKSSIGNVQVDSGMVRQVDTSVGSGNAIDGMKTRHLAKVYKDNDGIDATGTKNVYVSKKEKEKALSKGGAVGNTSTGGDGRIRKVKTFVE